LNSWAGIFCAGVALVTVWVIPLSLLIQIAMTVLFGAVPLVVLVFWLGRVFEHLRAKRQNDPNPHL
jgi:membrane protein DedA with SNARE-associated domain